MDITYRFVAAGHEGVEKAFTGIEAAAKRQKKAVDDAGKATRAQGAGAGVGSPRARVNETERLAARAAAAQERNAKREVALAARAQKETEKATERHENNLYRTRQRALERNMREQIAARKKDIKDATDKANKKQQLVEAAAKKERFAQDKANNERAQSRAKSVGVLKDLAGGALLGGVAAGGALIGSAASESMRLQEASARIAINSRKAGEKGRDVNELRRGFEKTAIATPGQSAADIADAVGKFVSLTGDIDTAVKSQGTFATVASASGANVGDVAEAAASLSQQFDIKGIEDMREALAALTFQGKEGSFELKDAAAQFQRLAASGAAFGIPKGVGGVKTLGGLTQIARSGTGSSEQAATAVENLLTNLKVKQTELKAQGVNVFDKGGKARDVTDLIVESISKVGGGDMAKKSMGLTKIFGEQGIRAINPLVAKYSTAFQGKEGTEAEKTAAGIAALRAEIQRSINAPGDYADVQEDAAMAQKQASAQLSNAWEALKAKTADALVPSFGKLAEALSGKESLLDPFIEALGLGAEAVVWFSKKMGFTKEKTKADVEADANRALDNYKKKNGITDASFGPVSPEQQALQDKVTAAHADTFGGQKSFTGAADFALQYAHAGDDKEYAYGDYAAGDAYNMAKDIQSGETQNDWWMKNGKEENQAQFDLRKQYEGQALSEKTTAEFDTKAAQEAATSFASTIVAVNAKIAASAAPSNI